MTIHSKTPTCAVCDTTFANDDALDEHLLDGGILDVCPEHPDLQDQDDGVPWDVEPEYTDEDGARTGLYCCCCGEKLEHALELDTGICDACTDVDHRPNQDDGGDGESERDLPEFEDMLEDEDGDGGGGNESTLVNPSTSTTQPSGSWQQFRY